MSLLRSQPMKYYKLVLPRESAWTIMNKLGEISCLQLVDMNEGESTFQRKYANYIKRCEELEVRFKQVEQELKKFKVPINQPEPEDLPEFLHNLRSFLQTRGSSHQNFLEEVESESTERWNKINEQVRGYDDAIRQHNEWLEYKHVLGKTRGLFDALSKEHVQVSNVAEPASADLPIDYVAAGGPRVCFLAGTIPKEDSLRFKRMIFRVTRGNTWTTLYDIEQPAINPDQDEDEYLEDTILDPASRKPVFKCVFLIVYRGGSYDVLKGRLIKICESFNAKQFPVPENEDDYKEKDRHIEGQLVSRRELLRETRTTIDYMLDYYSRSRFPRDRMSYIEELRLFVAKEKEIYHHLNLLRSYETYLEGFCWAPIEEESRITDCLFEIGNEHPTIASGKFVVEDSQVENLDPPSSIKTNEFSWPFQEIVNTYGFPRYGEVNPGLFTIITFPFLFGVMFGDIGHGGILFLFAIWLCLKADDIKAGKGALVPFLSVRYLLLLMGFFAFYCGFIYNDFMAIPWNLFGSCYIKKGGRELEREPDCTYPFGLDPRWHVAANELNFVNSFKMKLAIVLGVSHMLLGIFLKAVNSVHFSNMIDLFCEFVPQLTFMICTFGYMVAAIFIKWATDWSAVGLGNAPSIITTFIDMFFNGGRVTKPLWGDGSSQEVIQRTFLFLAVISVPWMLIPKPLILWMQHSGDGPVKLKKEKDDHDKRPLLAGGGHDSDEEGNGLSKIELQPSPTHEKQLSSDSSKSSKVKGHGHGHGHGEFDLGEVCVHSLIETIEFVLGSVSHTASYLRLWALSLAHAELSKVFFEKALADSIEEGSFIGVLIGFMMFANLTLGVLLSMDVMECFLHALRLHWIEFQSKFYKGTGHPFKPFSFVSSLADSLKKRL